MAPITHVVHFGYSAGVSNTEKHLIASKLLLLQDTCLLPAAPGSARARQPYILSISGGTNNSPEQHANGLEVSVKKHVRAPSTKRRPTS